MKASNFFPTCLLITFLVVFAKVSKAQQYPFRNLTNSTGLVIPNPNNTGKETLKLYSSDGKLWKSVSLEGPLLKNMSSINPYAKNEDYYLLAFDCLENKGGFYKVIINEDTKATKYIKANDKAFALVSWQNYILKMFAVGVQPKTNPLKSKPSSDSKNLEYNKDEIYMPVKFQNDWLQVKWGDEKKLSYGWVQWKKGNLLILELFPIA